MSKRVRNLLIALGIAIVLGAGLFLLIAFGPASPGGTSSTASSSGIALVSHKQDDVQSVTVKNKEGQYTVERTGELTWEIAEFKGAPKNTNLYSSLAALAAQVTAYSEIGETSDSLSHFGLDKPAITVQITYTDKSTYGFSIGNVTGENDTTYYMKPDGSDKLYLYEMDTTSPLSKSKYAFIETTLYEQTSTAEDADVFDSIELAGTMRKQAVKIEPNRSENDPSAPLTSFILTAPIKAGLKSDVDEGLVDLSTVEAVEAVAVHPDSAALKKYGLSQPQTLITITSGKDKTVISGGTKDGENFYAIKEGVPVIYKVALSSLPIAYSQVQDLSTERLFDVYLGDLSQLIIKGGGLDYTFDIKQLAQDDAEGKDVEIYYQGKKLNTENFQNFFRVLVDMKTYEVAQTTPSGNAEYTITCKYTNSSIKDRVTELIPSSARTYFVRTDGNGYFNVLSSYVDELMADVVKVSKDQTVIP